MICLSNNQISTILSLIAAISIVIAGFFQWWDITWNGQMVTRKWVKILFGFLIILLLIALILIVV